MLHAEHVALSVCGHIATHCVISNNCKWEGTLKWRNGNMLNTMKKYAIFMWNTHKCCPRKPPVMLLWPINSPKESKLSKEGTPKAGYSHLRDEKWIPVASGFLNCEQTNWISWKVAVFWSPLFTVYAVPLTNLVAPYAGVHKGVYFFISVFCLLLFIPPKNCGTSVWAFSIHSVQTNVH